MLSKSNSPERTAARQGGSVAVAIVGLIAALGLGMACMRQGRTTLPVVSIGDGAMNQGNVHESLNMGAVLRVPMIVVVNPKLPATNLKELIALGKERSGKITMASSGTGSSNHLAIELFNTMAGVKLTHVPYKGVVPALADLVAGQIQMLFGSTSALVPQAKAGKITLLATAGPHRSALACGTR
mgnify:CR=1 FL=1